MRRFSFAVLAYLVPTFALGFVWHLVLFQSYYDALGVYRRDIIIPFGFLSMLIQAAIFAWVYGKAFAANRGTLFSSVQCATAWLAQRCRGASRHWPSRQRT